MQLSTSFLLAPTSTSKGRSFPCESFCAQAIHFCSILIKFSRYNVRYVFNKASEVSRWLGRLHCYSLVFSVACIKIVRIRCCGISFTFRVRFHVALSVVVIPSVSVCVAPSRHPNHSMDFLKK